MTATDAPASPRLRMGRTTVAETAITSLAKRGANRMIHEIVSPNSGAGLIGFFCECADPDCHKVTWLAGDAFEHACADPSWNLLAPGHRAAASDDLER